jgi:hypothetical protein
VSLVGVLTPEQLYTRALRLLSDHVRMLRTAAMGNPRERQILWPAIEEHARDVNRAICDYYGRAPA